MTIPIDDPLLFNKYRDYWLYLPPGYNESVAVPVVFYFPSFYITADTAMVENKLFYESRIGGNFIVVIPNGMNDCNQINCQNPYPTVSWNTWGTGIGHGKYGPTCNTNRSKYGEYPCYSSCRARSPDGTCAPCISASCANDTLFFEKVLEDVQSKFCIDDRRIYITGMSVGGMMALNIATKYSDIVAGAVPVASGVLAGFWEPPKTPIPMMDIHGLHDDTIPANLTNSYRWGKRTQPTRPNVPLDCSFSSDGFYYIPSYNFTRDIAKVNGCNMSNAEGWNKTTGGWIPWPTNIDGEADWQCGLAFGQCPTAYPLVRCTWDGVHELPLVGKRLHVKNLTGYEKRHAFAKVAWQFLKPLYRPFR